MLRQNSSTNQIVSMKRISVFFFFQYLATLAQFKISETSTVKPLALLDHNVIYLYQ